VQYPIEQLVEVAAILFASSVVQGAIGFAAGLFGIPLFMIVTGMPLQDAVAISLVASLVQNSTGLWQLRRDVDFRRAWRPMLIRFALLPLGVATLQYVGSESRDLTTQVVGCVLLGIVAMQHIFRSGPRKRLHDAWEWLAFGVGGFLLGFCGMGGPPMVVWLLAHDWSHRRVKAFLYFLAFTGLVPQALCLVLFFGTSIFYSMAVGAAGIPIVLVGTLLGLWLGALFSEARLRKLSSAVLLLIGLMAIVMPIVQARFRG
jgi:uncharacterized membrane protein YfcA